MHYLIITVGTRAQIYILGLESYLMMWILVYWVLGPI